MRYGFTRISLLATFLLLSQIATAQNAGGSNNTVLAVLMVVVVLIALAVIIQVADSMVRIEANKAGVDTDKHNMSIFPSFKELFATKKPRYVEEEEPFHKFSRGLALKLEGVPSGPIQAANVSTFAAQPPNFRGIAPIPKLEVEVGGTVRAGDHLFFDKGRPEMKFVAPVSGEVIAVNRGDRRAITEIVILADKEQQYRELPAFDLENGSREDLVKHLLDTGGWSLLLRRPYNVVAEPDEVPTNIFISTFDTAPLAPDLNLVVIGKEEAFQKGLDVLNRLTDGTVYLGLDGRGKTTPSAAFTGATGVEKHWFSGDHPAGNVGVQIHHIAPLTPNTTAWTMGVQEVITLGKIFSEQKFDAERIVALTGAEMEDPHYVRTKVGANIGDLVKGKLATEHVRFISGDVLSGARKGAENFLNFHDDQVTTILEGDYYELFGWLTAAKPVPSAHAAVPTALFPDTRLRADTNTHGEKRAFVVTGEYEKVLPMDIYPQHLMKAVLTNDYERMEGLGLYELVEEDIAPCEFVCTSKQPLQQILREGLDMMYEQG